MINFDHLNAVKEQAQREFHESKGARCFVIDNFLLDGHVKQMAQEFEPVMARANKDPNAPKKHLHVSRKIGVHRKEMMSQMHRDFFKAISSPEFLAFLREVTGLDPIYADDALEGGGLHQIYPGGYLNIHTDFNFHPTNKHWHRRLNLLFYLNEDWQEDWEGRLELYDAEVTQIMKEIAPIANRMAVFETSETSFHGHPKPLACPAGVTRKSMATYFYTDWPAGLEPRERTNYRLAPWQTAAMLEEIGNMRKLGMNESQIKDDLGTRYQLSAVKEVFTKLKASSAG